MMPKHEACGSKLAKWLAKKGKNPWEQGFFKGPNPLAILTDAFQDICGKTKPRDSKKDLLAIWGLYAALQDSGAFSSAILERYEESTSQVEVLKRQIEVQEKETHRKVEALTKEIEILKAERLDLVREMDTLDEFVHLQQKELEETQIQAQTAENQIFTLEEKLLQVEAAAKLLEKELAARENLGNQPSVPQALIASLHPESAGTPEEASLEESQPQLLSSPEPAKATAGLPKGASPRLAKESSTQTETFKGTLQRSKRVQKHSPTGILDHGSTLQSRQKQGEQNSPNWNSVYRGRPGPRGKGKNHQQGLLSSQVQTQPSVPQFQSPQNSASVTLPAPPRSWETAQHSSTWSKQGRSKQNLPEKADSMRQFVWLSLKEQGVDMRDFEQEPTSILIAALRDLTCGPRDGSAPEVPPLPAATTASPTPSPPSLERVSSARDRRGAQRELSAALKSEEKKKESVHLKTQEKLLQKIPKGKSEKVKLLEEKRDLVMPQVTTPPQGMEKTPTAPAIPLRSSTKLAKVVEPPQTGAVGMCNLRAGSLSPTAGRAWRSKPQPCPKNACYSPSLLLRKARRICG